MCAIINEKKDIRSFDPSHPQHIHTLWVNSPIPKFAIIRFRCWQQNDKNSIMKFWIVCRMEILVMYPNHRFFFVLFSFFWSYRIICSKNSHVKFDYLNQSNFLTYGWVSKIWIYFTHVFLYITINFKKYKYD